MKRKSESKRESVFHPEFREDLTIWVKTDPKIVVKILNLVEQVMRDPFEGIGKPEPLRFLGSGDWSRRITQEHRIVYVVSETRVDFVQCRYHY